MCLQMRKMWYFRLCPVDHVYTLITQDLLCLHEKHVTVIHVRKCCCLYFFYPVSSRPCSSQLAATIQGLF